SLGKVSEAQQIMQRILKTAPDSPKPAEIKSFLAITALDQNSQDLSAAEPEVQRILKEDPNYVPALTAQADLQMQHGDAKGATAIYTDVLRHYPDFAPAQKRLASMYAEDSNS